MRAIVLNAALGLVILALVTTSFAQERVEESRETISASDQFIRWESQHNPKPSPRSLYGGSFDAVEMTIPHIEFQIDHPNLIRVESFMRWIYGADLGQHQVIVDFAHYLPKQVRDALLFTKDGKQWIRWPLSPYDTEFKPILEQYLNDRGVPYQLGHRFVGRSTSSRSTWQADPANGYLFSSKTSTNATSQGNDHFQYRPYPIRWGHLNRRLSDYYHEQRHRLKNLDVAWEAALIGLPPIENSRGQLVDAAMTVRLMDDVATNKMHHMSGFVLTDQAELERLANLGGVTKDQYMIDAAKAFGAAIAEMNLILGIEVTSAHLQNIRFELDKSYRLTGRVIILDLSDIRPIGPIVEANGAGQLLKEWEMLTDFENRIHEGISSEGDERWLKPFRKKKGYFRAMSEAMIARIMEIASVSRNEAEHMVDTKHNLGIYWPGNTQALIQQIRSNSAARSCVDLFRSSSR